MSEVSGEKGLSGVFARKSSGLVRTVSTFDTFYYCLVMIALPIGFLNLAALVFYPGASFTFGTTLALVGSVFIGLTYALFSAIYPRSGAEYVPLSRATHPLVGFVGSFSNVFWLTFYTGISAAFAATFGWAPLFTVLGLQLGNESMINLGFWFDSPVGWFVVGTVLIAVISLILYRGMALYFKIQRWLYTAALAGFVILLIVLALGAAGVLDFQATFNQYAGDGAYEQLVATAAAEGADLNPAPNSGMSLAFVIWPAFALLFAVWSTSFSGEVKNVTRGQLIAIPAAQILGGVLIILLGVLGLAAIGKEGLLAFGWVGLLSPENLPLPIYPWISTLASIMANNILLTIIIQVSALLLMMLTLAVDAIYATRGMLAWAIDGMAPSWLGEVSERYHTPKNAILVTAILALVFLALYSFTGALTVIAAQVPMGIVLALMAIAAAIFPFTKKDVYEASPARFQVAGIPLMTITGVLGTVVMVWVVYNTFIDPVFGANAPASLILMAMAFGGGVIWYFVVRSVRSKQGVDLDARFEEIPIE
jgi:amino acid transporter